MKKLLFAIILLSVAYYLSSCGKKVESVAEQGGGETLCGADKYTHGCIGSAGYVWSSLLQECVRPWEAGTAVAVPKKEADTYTRQYNIVFSKDSTKAELIGIGLLTKISDNVWQNTDGSIKVVKTQDGFCAE